MIEQRAKAIEYARGALITKTHLSPYSARVLLMDSLNDMSQADVMLRLLSDYQPHSTREIVERVYGLNAPSIARVGARIYDLKQQGHVIESWTDKENRTIQWYRLKEPAPVQMAFQV